MTRQFRKRRLATLSLMLPLLLFSACNVLGEDKAIADKESELHKLQGEISTLQGELSEREKRRQALQGQLKQAEQKIGKTTRHLRVLAGSLQRQQQRLDQLKQEQSGQLQALERNRKALAQQLRSAYAMGRQERVKILLNQQDPAVVSRMLVYYDYFNRARNEQIATIDSALKALQETEAELLVEDQRLRDIQAKVVAEKRTLDQDQQTRQLVLASLGQEIESKGQQLQNFKKDEQQLQSLVKRLQSEQLALPVETEKHKPFKQLKGKLKWPASGRLANSFGTARGASLKWDGVVIAAKAGLEVKAVHHGRVAFADWLRGFGLLLIIDHGDGYMSLYGHNQSLFKEAGEWVEPGESVALVGNSGGQTKSGVYFGIRYNGRPVNPKKWCTRIRGNRIGQQQHDVSISAQLAAIITHLPIVGRETPTGS
ncbi:MAG: peptidoglycan DD-metalloendopeptidase family protein [Sedimenticola sp.]|nr:peptidoglycan DD-metalloendopeptidase family protein [Sedimenticola sp.]